ncbi:hypothetical protein BC826DRAFT_322421 [Russula brevipes]|nr:hypothetical protein BC826DRAFT_322421 [Russula brevipes]
MIPSPQGNAPSSPYGLPHSSLLLVNVAHRSPLSSDSPIPSKSSHTSFPLPSLKKPDERPDKIVHPLSVPPAVLSGSTLGPQSPRVPTKRKRDSEPRSVNNSQLREARERVEQKRAKIAARVPSGMAGSTSPTPATVTSLAELYAQMRRDSGVSRQQDASRSPTTTVSGNGRVLDRRPQNPLRGHSSASSPDPIAMSEDDQEIVVLKHTQPRHPQVRPRFEPVTRLGPPAHLNLKLLSKAKSKTSTPKSVSANGIDGLLDSIRKSRPSFAVVVPSPPKRPTHKPVRVEQDTPVSDATHARDRTPAGKAAPHHVEKLKEITNGKAPEPLAVHTTPPFPARPVQPAKTLEDLVSEYGLSRSRSGISLSKALTARDIDILLGAVPLSFDFSLSHHHPATSTMKKGNGG